MKLTIRIFCLLIAFFGMIDFAKASDVANAGVKTHIVKSKDGSWQVEYTTKEPAKRLAFNRNPSEHRVKRWQPDDKHFRVVYQQNQEYIERTDGQPFSYVSLQLTPTYVHLTKDYAPFSPYSDGGTLFHSARFFACSETCDQPINAWPMTLTVPNGDTIIAHGGVYQHSYHWIGTNSGSNIYVGQQKPIEAADFVAVFDQGLPPLLKQTIENNMPVLMHYFAEQLGKVSGSKPMLFASYSNKPGTSSQGGTLPNQIFMHWDMNNLDEKLTDQYFVDNTLWFFAHEAAHFFQRTNKGTPIFAEQEQSWIHEGSADYFASRALLDLFEDKAKYVEKKVASYEAHCAQGLGKTSLLQAANNGQFMLYYSCGYFIHQAIDKQVKRVSNEKQSFYHVWLSFKSLIEQGEKPNATTFWSAVSRYLPADKVAVIQQLTEQQVSEPALLLKQLNK